MKIKTDIDLKKLTTIKLGGRAKYFALCKTRPQVLGAITFAQEKKIPFFILGGGSNVIFKDDGFKGIIIKIATKGMQIKKTKNNFFITVEAGESWDDLVKYCVSHNLKGIECLSGIPGSIGAAPVQNIGAYGQEVSQVIKNIEVFDCRDHKIKVLKNRDCKFGYRTSLLKEQSGIYIVLSVTFCFIWGGRADIKYPALKNYLKERKIENNLINTRKAVLKLRRQKSMLISKKDPNAQSCGSFFLNPKINRISLLLLKRNFPEMPFYKEKNLFKIPSAWLIEKAGFNKGYKYKSVAISSNHSLALIATKQSTTKDLLELQKLIQRTIKKIFGIQLMREPILVA